MVGKISFDPRQVLGTACEGTFVFRGSFEQREVAVNSAMILTGMARRMHLVAVQSLVARKTYNVISVTSLVT